MDLVTDMREWTFPISKAEMQADGSLIVEGVATSEALDNTEPIPEIVDYDNAKACMADWPGNVREMHQLKAVGRALGWYPDDEKREIILRTRVSAGEPGTIQKVLDGTLNSYSVNGPPLKRVMEQATKADGSRVTAHRLFYKRFSEISLVDRGMNPTTKFSIVKADGFEDEQPTEPVQVWACNDLAHRHVYKSEAAECMAAKVAAREDVKPSAGEGEYGDVAFADEKNKKYPIDTEAHIRAAWSYISKSKNAGKYSAADTKAIKARIVAAWKKKIDKEGPPSAAKGDSMYDLKAVRDAFVAKAAAHGVKLTPPGDDALKVGFDPTGYAWQGSTEMQHALDALYAAALVENLIRSERMEEDQDPDDERQIAVLEGAFSAIADFVGAELAERLADESEEDSGDVGDAMKAIGARAKSMITKENAQAVHNHVVKSYGAKCKAAKADGEEEAEESDGEKAMRAGTQPLHPTVTRIGPRVRVHLNKSNAQSAHDHSVSLGAKCMKSEKADDAKAEVPEQSVTEPVVEAPAVKSDQPEDGGAAKVQADLDAAKADVAAVREELTTLKGERAKLEADLAAAKATQIVEPGTPLALDAEGKPVPATFVGTEKADSLPISQADLEDMVAKAHGDSEVLKRSIHMRLAEKGVTSVVAAAIRGGR